MSSKKYKYVWYVSKVNEVILYCKSIGENDEMVEQFDATLTAY